MAEKRDVISYSRNPVNVTFRADVGGSPQTFVLRVPAAGLKHDEIVAALERLGVPGADPEVVFDAPHFKQLISGPKPVLKLRRSK
jgi:hypothetical protein